MRSRTLMAFGVALVVVAAVLADPAAAQVESQLSSYTGANAEGYMKPVADAFGTTLNSGYFRSAYLPTSGFHLGFEVLVMGLYFSDEDRTFTATTEGTFMPQQTATAPTIVGPGEAVFVNGEFGTSYAFPGGLNLNSFGMLAPQLRISSFYGTELVGRFARVNSGDAEIGDITLWGIGGRHNISQYFGEDFTIDLSAGFIYQKLTAGENDKGNDLMDSDAFSVGVNASKRLPLGFTTLEPYTALSYDSFKMKLEYDNDTEGLLAVDFDRSTTAHWTVGLNLNLVYANIYGEYNVAAMNSFGFGIAVGALGY